jgi:hypothetical protein
MLECKGSKGKFSTKGSGRNTDDRFRSKRQLINAKLASRDAERKKKCINLPSGVKLHELVSTGCYSLTGKSALEVRKKN